MAQKITAGDYTRGDFFFVDPYEIEVLEDLRGRHKPPTEDQIIGIALSMHAHGQRQPVECRKVADNRLRLNFGFTRLAAARLIRDGFTYLDSDTDAEVTIHDPEFVIKVIVSDANDKKAFENNIVENCHRNQTTPVNDAYNHQRLRDVYGYTDAAIAKLYGYANTTKVTNLRKLLTLNTEVQDMVHFEKMSLAAALDLCDIPEELRAEAIAKATNANGAIVASQVRAVVRDHILNDENRPEGKLSNGKAPAIKESGKKPIKARAMTEVRKFFAEMAEKNPDEKVKLLGKNILLWISGQRNDNFIKNQIELFAGVDKNAKPAKLAKAE